MDKKIFINQIVGDLYQRAANLEVLHQLPIKVVDQPDLANQIFNSPDTFKKNYSFLEKLSNGRFSANGVDWVSRAKLTQHFYHQSTHQISDEEIRGVYSRHFSQLEHGEIANFWDCAIASAIEVISLSYGFKDPIPWPIEQVKLILECLVAEQAEAWLNPADVSHITNSRLVEAQQAIYDQWKAHSSTAKFIDEMSVAANEANPDYARGELIQNLLAATETTASAFSWAMYCLGKYQESQTLLLTDLSDENASLFVDEVLRIFPPVPFVTRKLADAHTFQGVVFNQGEHILLSIVGLHCDANYWKRSMQFQFPRAEFVDKKWNSTSYRPFISGPRVCGGMRLAKRELVIGLQAALNQFRVLPISSEPSISYGLTSRPAVVIDEYLSWIKK